MTTFFYLGNGTILGADFDGRDKVKSAWYVHMAYELEMYGRSAVTEGEDGHYDLLKAERYDASHDAWEGTPRTLLEARSKREREDEEDVWYIDRDPELSPMAKQCPRWAAKRSGEPFYETKQAAITAMQAIVS